MKERTKQRLTRVGNVSLTLLKTIGVAGMIASVLVAPGLAQILTAFEPKRRPYLPPSYAKRALDRLKARGFIYLTKQNGKRFYTLSPRGTALLASYEFKEKQLKRPYRWDQKWRIVMFDVTEHRRVFRDGLRATLKNLGFVRLQDSVWMYPFDCEEIIELARTAHQTRFDALYLTANRFHGDSVYLTNFGLTRYRTKIS